MAGLTVLVIDDEPQIRRAVRNAILSGLHAAGSRTSGGTAAARSAPAGEGIRVLEAATGREGMDVIAADTPDVIILDLGLPDMSGLQMCREIRQWMTAPIIVLSARHADTEKVALLDAGADDYLTKPFSTIELMARLRARLRRSSAPNGDLISFGDITVDLSRRRVERAGELVHLTPTEWQLLRALVTHPRRTMTHQQLFRAVWGTGDGDAQQYLRVYVGHLRRKIEADPVRPRFIQTDAGVGYRFEPATDPGADA